MKTTRRSLFDDSYARIEYAPETNCLIFTLEGFLSHREFVETVHACRRAIRQTKSSLIISDTRTLKTLSAQNQRYNNKVLIPMWLELGIRKNAVIVPADIFARWEVEAFEKTYQNDVARKRRSEGFEVRMFDSFESAQEWILQ